MYITEKCSSASLTMHRLQVSSCEHTIETPKFSKTSRSDLFMDSLSNKRGNLRYHSGDESASTMSPCSDDACTRNAQIMFSLSQYQPGRLPNTIGVALFCIVSDSYSLESVSIHIPTDTRLYSSDTVVGKKRVRSSAMRRGPWVFCPRFTES